MNILITGFDPFNNAAINPSYEAIKLLPDYINGHKINKLLIPTSFKRSFDVLKESLDNNHYDYVILVGQAGGRNSITPEKVAINYIDASIKDNDNLIYHDQPINKNNKEAYFSTLPIIKIRDLLNENDIKSTISYSAGTFVCNYLMYRTLEYFENTNTKAGFVHVPFENSQVSDNKYFSMPLEEIKRALEIIISALD